MPLTSDVHTSARSSPRSSLPSEGDFDAFVAVLDPEVVLRDHRRLGVTEVHGTPRVAS